MPELYSCHLFVLLAIFQASFSQRRIKDGDKVTTDKKYAVYLVRAASAPVNYVGWTCGGAIVSPNFVVTAAACVEDVQHMYAIAGYSKFVPSDEIDVDKCTKEMKKKVVFTCVPKNYQFDYHKTEYWARIDIAVVKMESPFDFTNKKYETLCSYIPQQIGINYEVRYQQPGVDTIALGWGHPNKYRKDKDMKDYNQETLHYAPTRILDKKTCLTYFSTNKDMVPIIQTYMICTLTKGNLNDRGEIISPAEPNLQGCITEKEKLMGKIGRICDENIVSISDMLRNGEVDFDGDTRRQKGEENNGTDKVAEAHTQAKVANETLNNKTTEHKEQAKNKDEPGEATTLQDDLETTVVDPDNSLENKSDILSTPGICQNDHGGPLVTWMGTREVLIGVATLYNIDDELECLGPYLFTSTQCNSAFLSCILSMENDTIVNRRCENFDEHPYQTIERRISWIGHPDGPAHNEIIHKRHQVPMSAFQPHNTK